jgi:site-specific recombinase XerD
MSRRHTFRHHRHHPPGARPGSDLVTAATFLGHSRLDTTARYSQPSAEDLAQAAEHLK